jgi:hypothetical protein
MFRHLFKSNKLFRNSTIIIGGFTADKLLDLTSEYFYKKSKYYDEKLDNELFMIYCKDDIDKFNDTKLFNIYNFIELPIYASLEEIIFRDCGLRYLLMTRLGLNGTISNLFQSIGFSLAHEPINTNDIKNKYDNIDIKLANYYINYYLYLFTAGIIYGGATLLSKTIWIPTTLHTLHNQYTMYENKKKYNQLIKKL